MNQTSLLKIVFCHFFSVGYFSISGISYAQDKSKNTDLVIVNFDKAGHQVIRYSSVGDALDAHDGEIAMFNGVYYLYGTSYACGFEWQNKNAAFCGFKVYSSKDLQKWTDKGYLFDASTKIWQTRCNGNTYGCFRPHVIYNKKTKRYVLWINVYDNVSGYRVFTSVNPTGPFREVAEPNLAVNATAPAGGLNNGDHDTFVDEDGTAYLAYTDWRSKGSIVIEKLTPDYLSGSGEVCLEVTEKSTEAPGMFKRNGLYYVVYSDPNCGYCSGTGASYKVAKSPLGPWSESKKISDNSCGGQPSFVSTIKLNSNQIFLFGSDLWNDAAKNEALANYYWTPLTFNTDGTIKPLNCSQNFKISGKKIINIAPDASQPGSFKGPADIKNGSKIVQSFTVAKTGTLKTLEFPLYKIGTPDSDLQVEIFKIDKNNNPTGTALFSTAISPKDIGWAIKSRTLKPNIEMIHETGYCMVLSSATMNGTYGYTFDRRQNTIPGYYLSVVAGDSTTLERDKKINFSFTIAAK